jgi:predicted ATPase
MVIPDLPATFPPLKTLDTHPTNLPAQPTVLIGREQEIAAACGTLRRPDVRLLTLSGPGGTGKTRLALQVAAELLDDFEDGVYFVMLAPIRDPVLVLSAIVQTLGIRESSGRAQAESLKDYLREKRLLLLLDNFEQVVAAAPLVAELLAVAPRLKVLVTSRAALHLSGEREVAVPPLALPDRTRLPSLDRLTQYEAVRLFIERAQAVKADFAVTNDNAPAIAEICYQLDGLPLAIELAAARIKLFPPQALLARLGNRLKLLTGGARDLPQRQQTIRDTIAWSYDLLDAGEQALFARLGVFVGGWTLESTEAVCNADGDLSVEIMDGVAALVDQSLVRQNEGPDGEPRFTMLETIHEYALERLAGSGEIDVVWRRHAEYFLALAEAAEPHLRRHEQIAWLDRLEREHDNLQAALRWSLNRGEGETATQLAVALYEFWNVRHVSETRRWFEEILSRADMMSPTLLRAKALLTAGRVSDSYADQRTRFEESLAISQALDDKRGIADALHFLGNVTARQGDREGALARYEESLAIYRELGDKAGIAATLVSQAHLAFLQGEYERWVSPCQCCNRFR